MSDKPTATAAKVPRVAAPDAAEENIRVSGRVQEQQAREQRAVEDAVDLEDSERVQQILAEKEAAETELAKLQKQNAALQNATVSENPQVILDGNTMRGIQSNRAKQIAAGLHMDRTVPGGIYIVDGHWRDAAGHDLGEVSGNGTPPTPKRPVTDAAGNPETAAAAAR